MKTKETRTSTQSESWTNKTKTTKKNGERYHNKVVNERKKMTRKNGEGFPSLKVMIRKKVPDGMIPKSRRMTTPIPPSTSYVSPFTKGRMSKTTR